MRLKIELFSCSLATFIFLGASIFQGGAFAQEWARLPDRSRTVAINGQQVTFVARPEARFVDGPNNAILAGVRVSARLDDLQDKAHGILQSLAQQKSNCGTRWSFPSLAPTAIRDGKLVVAGALRVEQWVCAGPLKTFLASQTATFVLGLSPRIVENEIRLTAELEKFDLGGGVLGISPITNELKDAVSAALDNAFASQDAKLRFPPEVASINPQFTAAEIRAADAGRGEIYVEAQATVRASDMTRIMTLLSKQN